MQELSLLQREQPPSAGGGASQGGSGAMQTADGRRDFVDVMWQIADKRSCDEVFIRYECGHCIKAEIWVPALPKTREYTNSEADRRRFMQHSIFVLTKNPGAPKVQITVPEGRCRHCGRGQRHSLVCGPLQMELGDDRSAGANGRRQSQGDTAEQHGHARAKAGTRGGGGAAQPNGYGNSNQSALATTGGTRRLELPLSSHVFLAAMGQVCRLPDNVTPPPLLQNNNLLQNGNLKPFDGPALSREGLHQWSRKEIEDELKAEVVKYVGGATFLLMFVVVECLYLCIIHFGPSSHITGGASLNVSHSISSELRNLSSVSSIEMGVANSTWVLSALTLTVHKAFGPGGSNGEGGASLWWSIVVHPLWILVSIVLAPLLWVLDLVVAFPRFLLLHVVFALVHALIWRPCSWVFTILWEVVHNSVSLLLRCIFSRPTAVLSQIPMTNPMVVAMVLSLLVAALSAPQPPSLPLCGVWSELPGLEFTRGIRRAMSRSKTLRPIVQHMPVSWGVAKNESRPKGGLRGIPATRGQKDKAHAGGRGPDGVNGRSERGAQAGRSQESRMPSGSAALHSAPACFVCLERPSWYVLEPCGHRVVCGECAIQLVEAAARNRSVSEGVAHHSSEKGGGACPSCGLAITRAMRLFS